MRVICDPDMRSIFDYWVFVMWAFLINNKNCMPTSFSCFIKVRMIEQKIKNNNKMKKIWWHLQMWMNCTPNYLFFLSWFGPNT